MRTKLHLSDIDGTMRLEALLAVGSRIFFQTHFFPLIRMQGFADEIYLTFKSSDGDIPVLLNVKATPETNEVHCGGMIISNRNRFEKELLQAKAVAEDALSKNVDLLNIRRELETHQRQLETQLRKLAALNQQQQDIFKVIAHDLQEPLRKAVLFAGIVKSQNDDLPKNVGDKLDRIIIFTEQMRQMVMSLQRIEELDASKMSLQEVDLRSLIDRALISSEVDTQRINVECQLDCQTIYGDEELMKNMFIELFINSARFSNPGREKVSVHISSMIVQRNVYVESAERYLNEDFTKLTFSDDGIGFKIDASKVFKIFQRGEQFDKISTGLAYCRKIVELHQGTMIAKAIRSKGAGFTIFIPAHANP